MLGITPSLVPRLSFLLQKPGYEASINPCFLETKISFVHFFIAIEVAPVSGPMDSLENSQILNSTYGRRSSGSSTSPKGHSRPASQRSKRPLSRYSGKAGFIQGA